MYTTWYTGLCMQSFGLVNSKLGKPSHHQLRPHVVNVRMKGPTLLNSKVSFAFKSAFQLFACGRIARCSQAKLSPLKISIPIFHCSVLLTCMPLKSVIFLWSWLLKPIPSLKGPSCKNGILSGYNEVLTTIFPSLKTLIDPMYFCRGWV